MIRRLITTKGLRSEDRTNSVLTEWRDATDGTKALSYRKQMKLIFDWTVHISPRRWV